MHIPNINQDPIKENEFFHLAHIVWRRKIPFLCFVLIASVTIHLVMLTRYVSKKTIVYRGAIELRLTPDCYRGLINTAGTTHRSSKQIKPTLPDDIFSFILERHASVIPGSLRMEKLAYLKKVIFVKPFLEYNISINIITTSRPLTNILINCIVNAYEEKKCHNASR